MIEQLEIIAASVGLEVQTLLLLIVGLGVALAFYGVTSAITYVDPATARLAATREARLDRRRNKAILREEVETSAGILKTFLPSKPGEMDALRIKLIQAGYRSRRAPATFTTIRVMLALGFPLVFVGILTIARTPGIQIPYGISEWFGSFTRTGVFQTIAVLVFLGYWIPMKHVEDRAKETRLRITEAFPNALDLLQVAVEAGLGTDAAMTRVGNELANICPELSVEFLTVQQQIQAGRPRDIAMREMAERTGVETVQSFAKVVQQSMQFGTPMTEALQTYANEMRQYRELAAQEMANKLPVKMSVVLASCMLPALVTMTVGPTVIRYLNFTG